jgi:hypothetical protein
MVPDVSGMRAKAAGYRALARTTRDSVIHRELLALAEEYEQLAAKAEQPLPTTCPPSSGAVLHV